MLQQHFNNNTFKMEEKLYQNEGIDFVHIEFIDNEPMIELITQPRRGVLPMLDEELRIPGGCVSHSSNSLNILYLKNSLLDLTQTIMANFLRNKRTIPFLNHVENSETVLQFATMPGRV